MKLCPLLDRIDLHVKVLPVDYQALSPQEGSLPPTTSADMRRQVEEARKRQAQRKIRGMPVLLNSQLTQALMDRYCSLKPEGEQLMKAAFKTYGLSARAHSRLLKIARTIADLEGCNQIETTHVAEALSYRAMDGQEKELNGW